MSDDDSDKDHKSDSNGQPDKKCAVCNKKFGLGKQYQCSKCLQTVCARHSMKSKKPDGSKHVICDTCDLDSMKAEIKVEILEEISRLKENISIAKESYEKVEAMRENKSDLVKKLQEELLATERSQKIKEEELLEKLNEETAKGNKADESIDSIKRELEELSRSEKEMRENSLLNEQRTEETKAEVIKLKEKKTELMVQIEHISSKLKGSLPLDQVLAHLCETCKNKIEKDKNPMDKGTSDGMP